MFSEFFPKIGKPAPSDEEMLELLRQSVKKSRERHYHGDKGIVVLSPEGQRRGWLWEDSQLIAVRVWVVCVVM